MQLAALLKLCSARQASDLHLSPGEPPILRIHGRLQRLAGEALSATSLPVLFEGLLSRSQRHTLHQHQACDLRLELAGVQARVHLYWQQQGLSAAIRLLPASPPALATLGLPDAVAHWLTLTSGLILVCGATGSGKSTTLAAILHEINLQRACHILTLEDPIEFHHPSRTALVTQREVLHGQGGFAPLLRSALREDPDIIMVGEIRDADTLQLVLQAAETGHLVLSTLHTRSCADAVARLCGIMPAEAQPAIRLQLAQCLHAILAQHLFPHSAGQSRILAHEVLQATAAVRHIIRENRLDQLTSILQTGRHQGMHTLQQCIDSLIAQHVLDRQEVGEVQPAWSTT
ncbi:type IV pilus twitching motility protein PilT [Paludibacterium sp. B53371]|uniref:type IV pilus twitching motility protein PilT n=1 Tax=Paludibacterium sp. B53371 TaxID=2806263 RepID=UPI001C041FFC|nr:PilT/PilU family type 4a pilus ATPase [Paludibacterium sp. B53371]